MSVTTRSAKRLGRTSNSRIPDRIPASLEVENFLQDGTLACTPAILTQSSQEPSAITGLQEQPERHDDLRLDSSSDDDDSELLISPMYSDAPLTEPWASDGDDEFISKTTSVQLEHGSHDDLRNGIHRSRCNLPFLIDSSTQFCYPRYAPDFPLQLQLMELSESNVWNLYQAEAFTANLFSHMTEGELTNECGFNRPRIIRFRAFKDDLKRSQEISHRPVPPSVFATLPQFRGKGEKNIQDPTLFLNRFEQVMLSAGIPRDRWSRVLLMALSQPEDSSYWSNHLTHLPTVNWAEDREQFLTHFDLYDQRVKYQTALHRIKQSSSEGCQSYFDRSSELMRLAHANPDDPLTVSLIRRGISNLKLKEYLTIREDADNPYDFGRLCAATLMLEDRLHSPDSRYGNHPNPNPNLVNTPRMDRGMDSTKTCSFCKNKGHVKSDCRKFARTQLNHHPRERDAPGSKPEGLKEPHCAKCNGKHRYHECPENVCRTCDKKGHLNFNCPTTTCGSCKAKGHTDRSFLCPNNKRKTSYAMEVTVEDEKMETLVDELAEYLSLKDEFSSWNDNPHLMFTAFTRRAEQCLAGTQADMISAPVILDGCRVMAMLDTGSQVSIINEDLAQRMGLAEQLHQPGQYHLRSIFPNLPPVVFKMTTPLRITCGRRVLDHQFLVGPCYVDLLLGLDILCSLGLGVSGIPTDFPEESAFQSSPAASASNLAEVTDEGLKGVFTDLQRISDDDLSLLMLNIDESLNQNERIGVDEFCNRKEAEISIDVGDAQPTWRPQFEIPERLHSVIDDQIVEWIKNKKIETSSPLTRWNSSLLLAPKRDLYGNRSDWRTCFDARPINEHLKPDTYGIPKIRGLFRRVSGFRYCSALDLVGAFHQCPIRPEDRFITTFSWKGMRYQFAGTPFGLKHVPGHFQRLMTSVLTEHLQYVLIYIDDVFVFSNTLEEHCQHVTAVVKSLTLANLRLRRAKCHFGYKEASLLGHIIDGSSIRADPAKVSTFMSLKSPTTGKQVQALLGFIGYLRDYIPCFSKIAKPLEAIKNLKQLRESWGIKEQKAFDTLKKVLSSSPILSNPDFDQPFKVATDSSQFGNGAVLYQEIDGENRYISFFSRSLNKSQVNYPATKRELLAIVQSLKAFRYYLYGRKFELFTDHKAIVYMVTSKEPSYMLMNWFEELQEFDFTVIHRPGIEMVLPDALSRLYVSLKDELTAKEGDKLVAAIKPIAPPTPISLTSKPISCPQCRHRPKRISKKCTNQLCLDHCPGCKIHPTSKGFSAIDPVTLTQPVILDDADPNTVNQDMQEFIKNVANKEDPGTDLLRMEEVDKAHSFNHLGSSNLFKHLFANGLYWSGMKKMCVTAAATCQQCLQHNVVRKGFHPLRAINADLPWDHLAIDLGQISMTSTHGSNFFIVITDICTRFLIIKSLPNKASLTVARVLYHVFADFGVPKIMQSDNGSEFVNEVVKQLKTEFGFQHRTISAYYPQANGAAEANVKLVKTLLKKYANGDLSEWCTYLPAIQMALNTRISARHHSTPFSLMFTRPYNLFIDYQSTISQPMTEEQIMVRNAKLTRILYPAIASSSNAYGDNVTEDFQLNHRVLEKGYPEGAMVMKTVDVRTSGMDPRYEGPFKVLSRTPHGTYVLLDSTGALHPKNVPFSKLKLISVPEIFLEDAEHYEVEKVLKHKGSVNDRIYWVKWKGYPNSENTWVPAADFDAPLIIQKYWNSLKTQRRSKQQRVY